MANNIVALYSATEKIHASCSYPAGSPCLSGAGKPGWQYPAGKAWGGRYPIQQFCCGGISEQNR